jgi:hypothetical protein
VKQELALDPLSSNTGHYKYEDVEAKAAHKRMEYMNSLGLQRENKNAKPTQRTNAHNKTRSVMHMPNYYSNMSLIQEEPEEKPYRKLTSFYKNCNTKSISTQNSPQRLHLRENSKHRI